jgi:sugar/nucleoside kinase (ribokinase family)
LKTGITVSVTSARDRALITYLGAIASLRADDIPAPVLKGFKHLHVSSYYMQHALRPGLRGLFAAARAAGLTTSLDTGYDPAERWDGDILATLDEVDVFLPNETEIRAISGCVGMEDGLRALDNGHTVIVGKLGAEGCIANSGGELTRVEAFPIRPVDTTGAGDSFNAGFLHAWLRGRELAECLRFAAACGALSTRGLGGTTTQATVEEAEEFIHAQIRN